jgi:hypothetical protein
VEDPVPGDGFGHGHPIEDPFPGFVAFHQDR